MRERAEETEPGRATTDENSGPAETRSNGRVGARERGAVGENRNGLNTGKGHRRAGSEREASGGMKLARITKLRAKTEVGSGPFHARSQGLPVEERAGSRVRFRRGSGGMDVPGPSVACSQSGLHGRSAAVGPRALEGMDILGEKSCVRLSGSGL